MRLCSVEGCTRKHLAKGKCTAHYLRVYKHGTTESRVMRGAPVLDRIMAKTTIHADGCWIFTSAITTNGYGHIREGRRMRITHCVTYEQKFGPISPDLELDHSCRNRACCNPDHLEPVTHQINVKRGKAGSNWTELDRNGLGRFVAKEKGFI